MFPIECIFFLSNFPGQLIFIELFSRRKSYSKHLESRLFTNFEARFERFNIALKKAVWVVFERFIYKHRSKTAQTLNGFWAV